MNIYKEHKNDTIMEKLIKNLTLFILLMFGLNTILLAQVPPGIVPATGIPVLVPATLDELNIPNGGYCQLTKGSSGLVRSTTSCVPLTLTGHSVGFVSPNTHQIITSGGPDYLAGIQGVPGVFLNKFPNIQYWDTATYGIPRVMRLNDENPGSNPSASSAATYYFTPTEEQNVLVFWFAFVSQSIPWHDKSQNALFRVEMTDVNGNYVTGSSQNSTFYIIPETITDPIVHPCCQPLDVRYTIITSITGTDTIRNFWADWVRLAFDLRPYIGQTVKLRVIASECIYQAHYTYCYFTGYGLKGSIDVLACGEDGVILQAPQGFEDYTWFVNNTPIPSADGISRLERVRNTDEISFRCEMTSQTGAPFSFTANINYYNLFPSFTWEQKFDECNNKVEFTNTSEIYKINNGGNVYQPIQYVLWDFGDGNTSTEISPTHYYAGTGPYDVSLTIWDADSVCNAGSNEGTPIVITLAPSTNMITQDEVSTCEELLPYVYLDPLMGPNDNYTWSTEGVYTVTYPGEAWNGCDSIVEVTLTINKPQVRIEQMQDYCDVFSTELTTIVNLPNVEYLWSTEETSPSIIVTKHGTYSVTISDENNCTANTFIKILPCEPPVYIPSAITPSDKNTLNDCIKLHAANLISSIDFTIFNRFGGIVYHTLDKDFEWCGEVNGQLPLNVIYQYILIYTDDKGIERLKKGTITVL